MPEKTENIENTVNSMQVNAGFDFTLMDAPLKAVYERGSASSQVLIMLREIEGDGAAGSLEQFMSGLKQLFADFGVGDTSEIREHVSASLSETLRTARDAFPDCLRFTLVQLFLHITKPDNGGVEVKYAFSLKLECLDDDSKFGIFKLFSLDSVWLNVWNVSLEDAIYKKMNIKTIDELLA